MEVRTMAVPVLSSTLLFFGIVTTANGQTLNVGSGTLTVTAPASLTSTMCDAQVPITFNLKLCELGGTAGTVSGIKVYYANNANYEDANLKSPGVDATVAGGSVAVPAGGGATITGATATLAEDTTNCGSYTHICVVLTVTGDSTTTNHDSCILKDGGTTKTANCPDVKAGTFTITDPSTPSSISYVAGTATTFTFSLVVTETAGVVDGSLTDINLYFVNNAEYKDATVISSATRASKPVAGTPTSIPAGSSNAVTVSGAVVSLTVDDANCTVYSHVCTVITVVGDEGGTDDDYTCKILDATNAGVVICPDVSAGALVVTNPSKIKYKTDVATAIAFSLAVTASEADGSVTGVKMAFANNAQYEQATAKSTEVDAGNVAKTTVPKGTTPVTISNATASLQLDTAKCANYTHLCAIIQVEGPNVNTANDDTCIALGTGDGQAGEKECTGSKSSAKSLGDFYVNFFVMMVPMVFTFSTIWSAMV
ncbi:S-layer protein-like [Ptychodera flava]|uniref:S-layer protein-like n=1 Tax=Ptychodera flava TaxID=63121 RepID=UPI00396A76B9